MKYYFTFPQRLPTKNCFIIFEADDWWLAREEMRKHFGNEWAFQYDKNEWFEDGISQQEQYNLTEIKI